MIHRLRVQNYKSLIDVSVDLSPVTVLVGKSGTGKSNFVKSLRFLRGLLSASPQHRNQILGDNWSDSRPATVADTSISFEVDFSIHGIDEKFQYQLSFDQQMPLPNLLQERLDLGKKCLFHQASEKKNAHRQIRWMVAPELLQPPPPGPISLGAIPAISEVVIAFTALTSGIGCYVFSDAVLSGGKPNRSATPQEYFTAGLDDDAANYLGVLKEIASDLQDLNVRKNIVGALRSVNRSVTSVELDDIQRPNHVVVGHKFNGKTVPLKLSQESDGFRRFYAHLLALYQRPPKQTLIFEHPEDGIHPGALSLLAEEFKAAPENGRGQVILTTHSPKLLDHFDSDQIRVVDLDGFATRIGHVSSEQREAIRDKLLDAGELLTVDPARIQQEATAP